MFSRSMTGLAESSSEELWLGTLPWFAGARWKHGTSVLTDCGCSPIAVTKQSCLSLTGPVSGSWSDCKDRWTDFAEGRVEDMWTFLSMCGKDAVEGAQAAAASFDRNLPRALPRTPCDSTVPAVGWF